jgi:hypothetical protein
MQAYVSCSSPWQDDGLKQWKPAEKWLQLGEPVGTRQGIILLTPDICFSTRKPCFFGLILYPRRDLYLNLALLIRNENHFCGLPLLCGTPSTQEAVIVGANVSLVVSPFQVPTMWHVLLRRIINKKNLGFWGKIYQKRRDHNIILTYNLLNVRSRR